MEDSINKKFDPELNSISDLTWLPRIKGKNITEWNEIIKQNLN